MMNWDEIEAERNEAARIALTLPHQTGRSSRSGRKLPGHARLVHAFDTVSKIFQFFDHFCSARRPRL